MGQYSENGMAKRGTTSSNGSAARDLKQVTVPDFMAAKSRGEASG